MFAFNDIQNILPSLIAPALMILCRGIGNKVSQAAYAAALTGVFRIVLHCFPEGLPFIGRDRPPRSVRGSRVLSSDQNQVFILIEIPYKMPDDFMFVRVG